MNPTISNTNYRVKAIDGVRGWLAIQIALSHLVTAIQLPSSDSLLENWLADGWWATRPFFY